jgi:uncharacterized iron-regulated membrane protein
MRAKGDKLRRAIRKLHLWLGLSLGALFALLGLTGSILAFYPELDAALHPEIRAEAGAPDWDRALSTLREGYPDKQGPWRFEVTGEGGAIPARYYDPPERAGHDFRPMMVWLSPDGTRILRRDYWGEYAATFIYDLHYRLLLGKDGGRMLGWLGFGLLALLMTGLWAWWPRGSWAKALRFKRHAPAQRRLRDWHKLAGLSGLLLLLVLTGTGIMLELPEESDGALNSLGLPVEVMPHVHPTDTGDGAQVSIAQAIGAGLAALPGARLAWIETPPAAGGAFKLRVEVEDDPSPRFPHSFVWIGSRDGKVLALHDARAVSSGSSINSWVHPLHDGSALGLAGRILVAIGGLIPLLLFATGWARWRRRA